MRRAGGCRSSRSKGRLDIDGALVLDALDDAELRRPRRRDGPSSCARRAEAVKAALARPEVACGARADGPTRPARARPDRADLWLSRSTYSIVACDLEAGQWGVATQSKFLAVGSVVPWAEPGCRRRRDTGLREPALRPGGAGAPSRRHPRRGGRRAADRGRRRGNSASSASSTPRRRHLHRPECSTGPGRRTGSGFAAQGNILVGAETVDALAETFPATAGRGSPSGCSSASRQRSVRVVTAADSSRRRSSSSNATAATRGSPTSLVDLRVDDHPSRSRSCAGIHGIMTGSSARRHETSGSPSTGAAGRARAAPRGARPRDARAWAGVENSRSASRQRDRPVVLAEYGSHPPNTNPHRPPPQTHPPDPTPPHKNAPSPRHTPVNLDPHKTHTPIPEPPAYPHPNPTHTGQTPETRNTPDPHRIVAHPPTDHPPTPDEGSEAGGDLERDPVFGTLVWKPVRRT